MILGSLAALAFLPSVLRKTTYTLDSGGGRPGKEAMLFSLEPPLEAINYSGRKETAKTIDLKDLAAKSKAGLLVNFWATWCPPCVEEMPSLETLNRQLSERPELPRLVTISVDDKPQDVIAFFKTLDYPVSLMVLFDKDAVLSRTVGTTRFPETYWITPDGRVRYKWIGPQNWLGSDVLTRLSAVTP